MKRKLKITAGVILALAIVGACAKDDGKMMADKNMAGKQARAHIGHVMTGWKDTPGGKGLLIVAESEAKIARQHAGFAVSKPGNIKWMKTHVAHVLHAVDPSAIAKGPGAGYGVIKAAGGAAKHIQFAAKSSDASKNVRLHATHVAVSANNTVARAQRIAKLAKIIAAEKSVSAVAGYTKILKLLCEQMQSGQDDNGDGKISWKKDEGGLAQARKHMGFMMKGEKMM
jgi:hypothetical protein